MMLRWLGAGLILLSCAGMGFSLAAQYRKTQTIFRQMEQILQFMEWELTYRLTPLPELCRLAAHGTNGTVNKIFMELAKELEQQLFPDAPSCMNALLDRNNHLPGQFRSLLRDLGSSLGCFDLPGQLQGLSACRQRCLEEIHLLQSNQENRIRNYRMLGVCTGLALAILLI